MPSAILPRLSFACAHPRGNGFNPQCGYTMKANVIGHQPSNFDTDSSRPSLIRSFLVEVRGMLSMPHAGVLFALYRRHHKKHVRFYGIYLFTTLEDSTLQRLAWAREIHISEVPCRTYNTHVPIENCHNTNLSGSSMDNRVRKTSHSAFPPDARNHNRRRDRKSQLFPQNKSTKYGETQKLRHTNEFSPLNFYDYG